MTPSDEVPATRPHGLAAAVDALLGGGGWTPVAVDRRPVAYDVFLPGRTVVLVHGVARRAAASARFALVEKRTAGPGAAPTVLRRSAAREADAYGSALLDDLGPALRAPRLLDVQHDPDGALVLRLEQVRPEPLTAERLLAAAAALGGMAGRRAGAAAAPPGPPTDWIARRSQPEAAAAGRDRLQSAPGDRARRALRLLAAQPRLRDVLTALPQTLCHHDAVGANVFRDGPRTVLIDWETVAPGAVGADLSTLLLASVKRGDCDAALVAAHLDEAVAAYVDGVRSETGSVSAAEVERGFDASAGLGWKLVADLQEADETGRAVRRGSRPSEGPAAARAELMAAADLVLELGERALA